MNAKWCFFYFFSLIFSVITLNAMAGTISPRVIVGQAVKDYVLHAHSGASVKVIGSWVGNNKKYKNPLEFSSDFSDHDMTLVLPPGTDKKKALAEWKRARKFIEREVRQKLLHKGRTAEEIERVISSISVYPPSQLLGHPETVKEAKKIFDTIDNGKKLVPCLGKGAEVEGIFGPGNKAFKQAYEAKTGRVIYKMGNKVQEGFTDFNHMMEGYGKFTIEGSANLSEQFAEKVGEAIGEGNAKDVGKNLGRLKTYYRKTRDLTRVKLGGPVEEELDGLLRSFNQQTQRTYAVWLENNENRIKKILKKVEAEIGLCKIVESANPREIKLIRQILERRSSPWEKLFEAATDKWRAMAQDIPWAKIVHGLNIMIWVSTTTDALHIYQEKGLSAATNFLLKNVMLASINLPASLTYSITEVMAETALKHVESIGYSMVTRYQECDQLIAGVFMVKGRERVGKGMEIQELARKYAREEDVLKFLESQAEKAAHRDFKSSSVEAERIEEIKKLLMAKCGAKIVQKWKDERERMFAVLLQAKDRLNKIIYTNPIVDLRCKERIDYKSRHFVECLPVPAVGRRMVLDALSQVSEAIKALDGSDHKGMLGLKEVYLWKIDGRIFKETIYPSIKNDASGSLFLNPGTQAKIFPLQPGTRHSIELKYQLSISPEFVVDTNLFEYCRKIEQTFSFTSKAILNTGQPVLRVTGTTDISLGEMLILKASIGGISPTVSSAGDTFKVVWFNGDDEIPASGMTLWWKPAAMGRYPLRVVLYQNGNKVDEADVVIRVTNTGISRNFYALDAVSGHVVKDLHVALTDMTGAVEKRNALDSTGRVHFSSLKTGVYLYRLSAPGYKDLKGDVILKDSGKNLFKMVPEKKKQELVSGPMTNQVFKLNYSKIVMGHHENRGLRATVVSGKGPYMVAKNVTSEVQWSVDQPEIIVQTEGGVIVSGNKDGACTVRARYMSKDGEVKDAFCLVTVQKRTAVLPVIDFDVAPEKPFYQPGELITFTQRINVKKLDDYYFTWYLDTEEKRGPSITHIFTEPGNYSVRLVVKSIIAGKEDALVKTVHVEALKSSSSPPAQAPNGKPYFVVTLKPYSVGQKIHFTAMNVPASFISYWVVKHKGKVKRIENTTPTLSYTPQEEGKYGVAVVYFRSADDRSMHSLTRWVKVESGIDEGSSTANGIIASRINRFSMEKIAGTPITQIQSSYWREGLHGKGYWTHPVSFERIAKTRNIILKTGRQSDGYNTGWLVFVPDGRNEIQFRVYHFDFSKHEGIHHYGGTFNLHGKTVDPRSLSFIEVHSRAAIVQWKATDGSIGRVRVSKYGYGGNPMVSHGIKEIFFTDFGGNSRSQSEKHAKIPWKTVGGLKYRFVQDGRCELKISPKIPELRVVMKTVGGGVYNVDPSGEIADLYKRDSIMRLNPGFHRLPLPSSRSAARKKIIGYKYYGWKYDKRQHNQGLVWFVSQRIGKNVRKLALDNGIIKNQSVVKLLTYHDSNWPVRLKDGKLEVAGDQSHPRTWSASHWITLGTHVDSFTGVGTGQGPLLVFRKRNTWTAILLQYNTGSPIKKITENKTITISGNGRQFGAIIRVGGRCYDFSSNNLVRTPEVNCQTGKWTGGELP